MTGDLSVKAVFILGFENQVGFLMKGEHFS